jgi:hypothetical protein
VILPPEFIFVLRLPPTPTFFLNKKPGKVDPPNQNCPFEGPEPKADDIVIIYPLFKNPPFKKAFVKLKAKYFPKFENIL